MFSFGKRKKYNGEIDVALNLEYQIRTRNNRLFPGVLAYLEHIDLAWTAKMSSEEASLYIATLYYCGLVKAGHIVEAEPLLLRIYGLMDTGLSVGDISEQRAKKFMAAIADTNDGFGIAHRRD